nr:MAG TPA: hypothetical protein [Caudoviricetes sp.]
MSLAIRAPKPHTLYRRTFRCEETITITKPIRSPRVSAIRNLWLY